MCARRRTSSPMRVGFTLIEVLVAMTIAATVVVTARLLLERLGDEAMRLAAYAARTDSDANAEQTLRDLVGRLEVGTDDGRRFAGQEQATRFTSWCDVPAGWQERCTVTLAIDAQGERRCSRRPFRPVSSSSSGKTSPAVASDTSMTPLEVVPGFAPGARASPLRSLLGCSSTVTC